MKLFLSHAFEDKDFVRQLHDRLVAEGFEVWLDERQLKVGDSILGKINEGLISSDYGVVVLSPMFFGKKWTRTELDALMALETTTRKMILPIWKNITAGEIAHLMPTMAGRFAVSASAGLDAVVHAIKGAVGAAEHQRELSKLDQIKLRLDRMAAASKARKTADLLLNSIEGVRLIHSEVARLGAGLEVIFNSLSSDELKFTFSRVDSNTFNVQAPYRYALQVHYSGGAYDSTAHVSLVCTFYQIGRLRHFGERESPRKLNVLTLFPYFDAASTVVWSLSEKREEVMTTDSLIALLVEKVAGYLDRGKR